MGGSLQRRAHEGLARIARSWWLPVLLLLATGTKLEAQYLYTTNNGTITITRYTGPGGVLIITNRLHGLPVTSIGETAFEHCTNLTGVTIPGTVTSIEFYAFSRCTALTNLVLGTNVAIIGHGAFDSCTRLANVTLPASVTGIGNGAFAWCASLTSMAIPDGVTDIEDGAFSPCTNLNAITVGASNSMYSSVAGVLFDKSQTTLVQYPGGAVGPYTIADNVFIIARTALAWCTGLSAITVGDANIRYSSRGGVLFDKDQTVLLQCPGGAVGAYSIPPGVTRIEDYAFAGCGRLTGVTIPDSVTSIEYGAFGYCTLLPAIAIPGSVTNISGAAFESCTSLTRVTIPDSITCISAFTFSSCTSLTNVTMTNSIASIWDYAFVDCSSLPSVTIPGSVTGIGDEVFYGCTALSTLYFKGNAPTLDSSGNIGADFATIYYLFGTTGWTNPWGGSPTLMVPPLALIVTTPHGKATPGKGTNWYNGGTSVTAALTNAPVVNGPTQYVCVGWSGTGSVPANGTGTNTGPFTMTNTSSLTWLWKTNVWLDTGTNGNGSVNVEDGWWAKGSNVLITATPAEHYHLSRWTGQTNGCTITSNRITVVMNQARAITATFLRQHTLTVSTTFGQSTPAVGTSWHDTGVSLTTRLINSPVSGGPTTQYVCRGWTGTGSVPASGTTTNAGPFTITTNSTITWLWRTNGWMDVAYTGSGRLSTGDCWLALGTNVLVTATASNHWHFGSWSGDTNGCTLNSNKITVAMNAARAVTAAFAIDQHKLTVTTPYGGSSPFAGTNWCDYGTSNTVAITNSPVILGGTQYVCRGWTGTGSAPASGTNTVTTAFALTMNSTVTWLWKTNFWLDGEVQGQGSLSTGDVWVARGTNVQITATKSNYWTFSRWTGDTNGCTVSSNRITMVMNQARQVVGVFSADVVTNRVPKWWLAQYGLTNFNTDAMGDLDHDGMLAWQEWVAGCNPADGNSVFQLMSVDGASGPGRIIRWPSIPNRFYGLTRSTNLALGANGFLMLPGADNMPATPTENSYTDTVEGVGPYFYRLDVRE